MKKLGFILAFLSLPALSYASCYGTSSHYNCYDYNNGNSYNVRKSGDYTYMDGYNSNTGSSWSQTSRTSGDTTYHSGYASNGNYWDQTIRRSGDTTYYSGTDSKGNYYSKTCTSYGCY